MKTYWVEYKYTYKVLLDDDCGYEYGLEHDFDSGRFKGSKKELESIIKSELEEEFGNGNIISVSITDCYETSEYEI